MSEIIPDLTEEERDHLHRMVVLQPGEQVVCKINHHPFGIVSQYIIGVAGLAVAAIFVILMIPKLTTQFGNGSAAEAIIFIIFGILVIGIVVMLGIASKVYWNSHWIVTTDSLTQVNQSSLFGIQVSELSLENLEDVTVLQTGILAHWLRYGTLRAETAGERSKFVFSFCPNPHEYARLIIDAREKFVQSPAAARAQAATQTADKS